MNLFIPVILGTGRPDRRSEAAARFTLAELAQQPNVTTELIDVRDYTKEVTKRMSDGAGQSALQQKIIAADGYVIVTPEYNHGYPGELKIFLDTFDVEFDKKPVAVCGVSEGINGGTRVVEQLRALLVAYGLVAMRRAVYFRNVETLFAADGSITDPSYAKGLAGLFGELIWYAGVLKAPRQQFLATKQ